MRIKDGDFELSGVTKIEAAGTMSFVDLVRI